ncbi:hypothetical protein DPSP01_001595 [Paraphaeosphaeria sporulosa]
MRTSLPSIILLLAASPIFAAQAQNTTNTTSTPETCGGDIDWLNTGNSSANSTGQVEFRWTDNSDSERPTSDLWYLSVTVNDTLRRGDVRTSASNGGIELRGYVSVPDDVKNASLCLYQFSSANVTLDDSIDDGLDSCGGIVSEECKDFIKDNFLHEIQPSGCPLYRKAGTEGADTFRKACPNLADSAAGKLRHFPFQTAVTWLSSLRLFSQSGRADIAAKSITRTCRTPPAPPPTFPASTSRRAITPCVVLPCLALFPTTIIGRT